MIPKYMIPKHMNPKHMNPNMRFQKKLKFGMHV